MGPGLFLPRLAVSTQVIPAIPWDLPWLAGALKPRGIRPSPSYMGLSLAPVLPEPPHEPSSVRVCTCGRQKETQPGCQGREVAGSFAETGHGKLKTMSLRSFP